MDYFLHQLIRLSGETRSQKFKHTLLFLVSAMSQLKGRFIARTNRELQVWHNTVSVCHFTFTVRIFQFSNLHSGNKTISLCIFTVFQ